jgi:hypothetical protein
MHLRDMSDEELKQVLVSMASKCGLVFENLDLIDAVVALIAQKRRMPGFGNGDTVGSMLNFAKACSTLRNCPKPLASKAARLDEAQQAVDKARREGVPATALLTPMSSFAQTLFRRRSRSNRLGRHLPASTTWSISCR